MKKGNSWRPSAYGKTRKEARNKLKDKLTRKANELEQLQLNDEAEKENK